MSAEDQVEKLRRLARENGIGPELIPPEDLQAPLNSNRPKIKLPGDDRELSQFAHEVGGICKERRLFRRDITPVIVNEEKGRLDVMNAEMLRTWVETHLVCIKERVVKLRENESIFQIVKTMNVDTARGTLAAWQFWGQLSEIERINTTRLPVIKKNRQIELLKPGYFAEQGIYTMIDDLTYDEGMTMEGARGVIDDLLGEFPYHDEGRSKAVQVAAMLTMFCASMLPKRSLRPGFIYTANSVTAGKTLGAKIAIIPVIGSVSTRTFPRREEAKKVLDSMAMDAAAYILFDNIRGKIAGEEIEAFITSTEWEGRILGESTKFKVENVATVFMTGNQSTTSADMASRCLFVELFVEEADVRERKIRRVIDDNYLASREQRSAICSALWTLVRAWDAAGRPGPVSVMPRFETWSNIVAAMVSHAGYGDPCARPNIAGAEDLDARDMGVLVNALATSAATVEEDEVFKEAVAGEARATTPCSLAPARLEWKFDEIMARVKALGLFEDVEIKRGGAGKDRGGDGGGSGELFDGDGVMTHAARSHFGKLFAGFHERVFAELGDEGEGVVGRLRFLVEGKGNQRKFAVARL